MRAAFFAFLLATTQAVAGDVALVIGNENYAHGDDIRAADELLGSVEALEQSGFEVISGSDLTTADMTKLFAQFVEKADGSGRAIVALSGHFASVPGGTVFLATEADAPDFWKINSVGISIELLAQAMEKSAGGAVMVLGTESRDFALGDQATLGIGEIDAPQGVTVVQGDAGEVAEFVEISLPYRGITLKRMLIDYPQLKGSGFLSDLVPFRPQDDAGDLAPVDETADERALWRATQTIGTQEAYKAYIDKYPGGIYAKQAREALDDIIEAPKRQAETAELNLNLSRNDRRQIQRNLSLLEFDPRGIDGIFGPGSRGAITKWQQVNGEAATGYVTRDQLVRLQAQADKRAAELEAEAAERQRQLERQDRAYWRATGQLGDEAGLRAYLERYPDGLFAEVALARLAPFEEARRAQAAAQDRADWDAAVSVDTEAAYQGYLQANPEGAFAEQAQARLAELEFQRKNAAALQAAERNEARLGLGQSTKRLVENRLEALGLKPGPVDGVFDETTRRAIRRYQDARRLQKTGYLNQATIVRLMADSVLR